MNQPASNASNERLRQVLDWRTSLQRSDASFPSREQILQQGGSPEEIVFHLSNLNIASLTEEDVSLLLEWEPDVMGWRAGAGWAQQLLGELGNEGDWEEIMGLRPTPRTPSKGGRPRADWTADLWLACTNRILSDEGMFANALELRHFMADWLGQQDLYPVESTIASKANEFIAKTGLSDILR